MTELTLLAKTVQQGRRRFLLGSVGTIAFPFALVACGGSDDDGSSNAGTDTPPAAGTGTTNSPVTLTRSNAKGTISLPAGATVTVASVQNAFGTSVPAADGSFDFVSVAESEMYAVAIGSGGKMLLCGLLQAGAAQLSARSTAACLAYNALGVGVYVPATQAQYLAAIQAAPTLAGLESAVAAAIVARGEAWLDLTDPALKSALAAVQAALSPVALSSATNAGVSGRVSALGAGRTAGDGTVRAQGMVIDKTARTSGLQVTGDGVATITLTNFYRRRSYAYIDRVSYQASFTSAPVDSPATVGTQPTKVDATKSITNSLVTLAQLYAGVKDFYDPVVLDGIATPLAPAEAALTTYRVTSVGLGVSSGDLGLLTADQHAGLLQVCAETVVLDIIVPIFCGILIPIRAASMTSFIDTLGVSRLKDVISSLAAADDILLNKIIAANRPLGEVLWDTLLTLVNSDTFKNALLGFFQDIINLLPQDAGVLATNVVNVGAKALLDAISTVDLTAQTMDMIATGLSFAFSDLADRFTIDVTKSAVRLNPQSPTADPGSLAQINFTLSVIDSDLVAGDLSYKWNCPCAFGDISDGTHTNTANGTTFDSSSPNLSYVQRGNGKGGDTEVVTGTIYKGSVLATRVPIGTATTKISYNTAITPASVQLLTNTQQTFTADISPTLLASGATLNYVWTLAGTGSIGGAATVTTTTPSISYTSPAASGTDNLSLAVTGANGTVLSRGSSVITVLSNVTAGIAPQNPQVPRGTTLNFVVNPSGASFPSGTTFKWVLTRPLDLFGGMRDLGGSGGGIIGVNISAPSTANTVLVTSMTGVKHNPKITFVANPFGGEAVGDSFYWYQDVILSVTVLGAGGAALATSSTPIQTQLPHGIMLP